MPTTTLMERLTQWMVATFGRTKEIKPSLIGRYLRSQTQTQARRAQLAKRRQRSRALSATQKMSRRINWGRA